MSLQRALTQALESLQRAGVDHLPRCAASPWVIPEQVAPAEQIADVKPIPASAEQPRGRVPVERVASQPPQDRLPREVPADRPAPAEIKSYSPAVVQTPSSPALTPHNFSAVRVQSESSFMKKAPIPNRSERESCLSVLAEKVARCTRCPELARTRTQTVFGVGNPEATVMFIGEAPGADEDKQGEPFVGRAGQLLNKIIAACGWQREDLYICNILRCRPPGNRNPTPIEADHCREYLDGQIETVSPKYIVCWGTIAAQNLLGNNTPIGRLRGQLFDYGKAKVLCTYHPSYLLRNPSAKKFVWEDLKVLLKEMGIDPDSLAEKNG